MRCEYIGRLDDRGTRLDLLDEVEQRPAVVGLGEALALQEVPPLELGVGVEEAVGGDELDPGRVRPAAHQLAQDAGRRRLADRHRPGDADDEGGDGERLAEEVAGRLPQAVDRLDVEVQQPRERQVDVLDLAQVQPVAEAAQPGDVVLAQAHRVVLAQPGPGGAVEVDVRGRRGPGLVDPEARDRLLRRPHAAIMSHPAAGGPRGAADPHPGHLGAAAGCGESGPVARSVYAGGHVWNRRIRRPGRRRHGPGRRHGGPDPSGVPRLRLGGGGPGHRRRHRRGQACRQAREPALRARRAPPRGVAHRHRAHPLGHPRRPHGRQRAPAPGRRGRPAGADPQRHHRELPLAQARARGRRRRLRVGDRHRGGGQARRPRVRPRG